MPPGLGSGWSYTPDYPDVPIETEHPFKDNIRIFQTDVAKTLTLPKGEFILSALPQPVAETLHPIIPMLNTLK